MIITSTKKKKLEELAPIFSQETKQAIKNTFSSPESELAKAKIKLTWKDGYQVGDVTKTILNVKDMISPVAIAKRKGAKIGNQIVDTIQSGDFVKSSKTKQENKKIWDNGYQFGDITKTGLNVGKTILGTTGDVVANLAKGELQTAEGLVDTGRYLLSDITKLSNPALSARAYKNSIQNTTGVIFGENDMYNKPKEDGWLKKLDEYSVSGNSLDNIVQSVGQQAFRVGLQGAVGMTGASEGATAAFNKLEIFAGSYGSAKSDALRNGADDKTATIRGMISGTSEYISENLFDSIPGFKTGELKGITKVKDIIGKSTEKAFGKTAGKAMVRIFSALGEGTEERLSNALETAFTDVVNAITPEYTYGMQEGQGLTESTFGKNAIKLFEDTMGSAFSKESNEAFVSAFFSTLITGAIADTMTNAERKQVIKAYAKDNNITNEQATKLFDNIRDLRLQQITDNNTDYEQRRNIEDNLTKQLSQEIKTNKDLNLQELQEGLIARDKFTKAVGTGVVSSKGLDLVESYKAYNGDSKYTNEIQNIQKFMNNRNIDARFDATMFENNEQNAIWTTENGQDSVVFNPNASQDQVIQSIATHEMTHDIINQKTEAGTSLFNDVLENIKTQKDYAKNRQEIEDLYAKYYDRNSKDFAAKVDEEMVANELGKNLGTQEYINRLVNEKPNLARRIYNWVVDKLDNIGKSEEYKEQKAYWKSVADKFEKAYNEQKTATGEDKTAYSLNNNNLEAYLNDNYNEEQIESIQKQIPKYAGMDEKQLDKEFTYINDSYQEMIKLSNDTQKEYKELQQTQEWLDALHNYDFDNEAWLKGDEYANKIRYYNREAEKYFAQREAITAIRMNADTDTRSAKQIVKDAENHFGTTDNFKETAYITTTGNQLDFSGYHEGGQKGSRSLDHRQINEINTDMDSFIEQGNIRVLPESGGINLAIEPNQQQYDKLRDYIEYAKNNNNEIYVDVVTDGGSYDSINYKSNTPTSKIINDIKAYFRDGEFPQQSRYADFRYSLTKDNTGRELSEGQREYFKDSKAVDDDGNLVTVYHTMTDKGVQFNEFNPVGTEGYKFGDQVVNFYTNSKIMSDSYSDYKSKKADTSKLNNIKDAKKWIQAQKTILSEYDIKDLGKDGYSLTENGQSKRYFKNENDLLKNLKQTFYNYNKQFGGDKGQAKYQYEGYVNITNPYIIEANESNWDNIRTNFDEISLRYAREISEADKTSLIKLAQESKEEYSNIESKRRNIKEKLDDMQRDGVFFTIRGIADTQRYRKDVLPQLKGKTKEKVTNLIDEYENISSKPNFEDDYFIKNVKPIQDKINDEFNVYFSEQDLYSMASTNFVEDDYKGIFGNRESTNSIIQDVLNKNKNGSNYDGVIIKKVMDYGSTTEFDDTGAAQDVYVTFNSNQFKAVDNLNPTEDADIRYSMQQDETPVTPGTRTTMGELFENNMAPIREDLSNIREQMNNLSNQLETMQESLENTSESANRGYVEPFREQRYENESYTPLTEEEADLYQNALLNDEAYRRSVDEQADFEKNNTKLINKLTDDVQSRLGLNKNQKSKLESIIKDVVDNDLTTDEIANRLQGEFKEQEIRYANDEIKSVKKLIKQTALKVSDGIKKDIADYGDFQRSNYNKITFSKNGIPVDTAYQILNEQAPGYFPSDIINPTDQLLKISDVANMLNETVEKYEISDDMFDNMADYIKNSILEDEYNTQMESQASLDTDIRMNFTEDIAPTTIRSQESIDEMIENRDIAPVREDAPKQRNKSELKDRFDNMRRKFSEMVTNRNYVIDETARATGNNEIKYAGDNRNNVSGETQYNIHNKQTDINGKWIGKGLNEIFKPAKNEGLADVFNDYLFHKSNIERHNVGKGSEVPSIVSQQLVAKYEQQYPQVKEWIKDLYKFEDNLLQEQVDSGIITQEKYNDYRGEHGIYRSYVPFYPGNIERSRYFDDEGNIKPVSTLKRSKGGAGDVNTMLSMEEAIARQVYASKRAIRDNELYKEIVSSLEKYEDMMDQDVRDNPTNLDDSLYITPDGEYVLSAYFDGEKVSAKISEELYNELAGTNENRIRQIEEDFSLITNPLQKVSNVRRNLLTTWNPTFLARNAIKDIQDAAINSKYTKDMLANYFGTKKGSKSAIMELRDAKTETAQQFLALYGADNLYGDYSNTGKSNKLVNKFSRINELIELAPRYAEFKATLENGGTVNEAIYNAREVTTNFGRGGYITKALNRNGFTFLNANVQGLNKVIRNLSGENGAKGVASVVVKGAAFAVLPSILNHLLYGSGDDKDEEYDALPDYIKDNYYLIKLDSGKFLRIPKGRINAVFGSLARRSIETLEGEDDAFKGYGSNAWSQIGVGDLGSNNIFTPIRQAFGSKNGTAWYGGDIVPTRLQNVPAAEQTDASIDAISNAIGKVTGLSPYKINYVLDQYSGGIGDVLLPMMTEETTSGAENPLEYLTAPIKDSFVVNSTDDNKYAGEFYDTKDKLQIQSNSQNATDEDKLKYKYMSSVSTQLSELYKERREVQADTTLGNKEKYAKVQAIQNEINSLAKEAVNNYKSFEQTDNYASIGEFEYYKDAEDGWTKVKDSESEFTAGLNASEKTAYYNAKNKISGITQEYTTKTKDLDKDSPLKQQYSAERKENITRTIINSGLDNYTKAMLYSKYYSDKDTMTNVVNAGYNVDTYITALNDIEALRTKYSQKNGYSTEQRKAKTLAYINSLEMNIPQKAMLTRQYYSSFRTYNKDIVNYVSGLNITQDEKISILKDTGMTVNGNQVSWK